MHIYQNATPPNLATVLCLAQVPLRGAAAIFNHQTSHSIQIGGVAPKAMAEAAAAAEGESVCQCNVRVGL